MVLLIDLLHVSILHVVFDAELFSLQMHFGQNAAVTAHHIGGKSAYVGYSVKLFSIIIIHLLHRLRWYVSHITIMSFH